jgi:hypothetical protein
MRVLVIMERACTNTVEIEVESLKQLNDIMSDSSLLNELIDEQDENWEEVCGECLDIRFESIDGKLEYAIGTEEAIEKPFN